MNGKALAREPGEALGDGLEMSGRNTRGVIFDEDEVVFEMHDGQLYFKKMNLLVKRQAQCPPRGS